MHKILLNSVLLSPSVSGGVRPKSPRQTPLGHNSPCLLPFVGRLGSGPRLVGRIGSGVRVSVNKNNRRVLSYDVLRQQKTGLWPRGCVREGVWPPLRRTMSSPSQTLRRRLVRTTDDDAAVSARRLPPFVAALLFTLRDSYGWPHCRPVCSEARYSSRIAFFAYPTCIRRLRWRGFRPNIAMPFSTEKLEWCGYPMVKKFRRYVYSFWHDPRTWQTDRHTNGHTDTAWRHRPRSCIASRGKRTDCYFKNQENTQALYWASFLNSSRQLPTRWLIAQLASTIALPELLLLEYGTRVADVISVARHWRP